MFKNGPSKICGRQPLRNLNLKNFLKAVFHKFYLIILEYFVPNTIEQIGISEVQSLKAIFCAYLGKY